MTTKKQKEFVISDETLNSFGFVVLTTGIKLEKFIKNPVMFYNHDREGGVIGKWENIHVDNGKLLATPLFDDSDELGIKIAQKVENGFIRAASIGIEILELENDGEIILSSELVECSICDVPSNSNALMLYQNGAQVKNKETYLNLNSFKPTNPMKDEDLKKILEALGLNPDATIEDILSAIDALSGESPNEIVENAIKMNVVKAYEKKGLLKMAQTDYVSFAKYMKDRNVDSQKEQRTACLELINAAVRDGRLPFPLSSQKSKEFLLNALMLDFEAGKLVLESLNKRTSLSEMIKSKTFSDDRSGWSLSDYRKKAPHELASNPGLYKRLLEEDKNIKLTK